MYLEHLPQDTGGFAMRKQPQFQPPQAQAVWV